MNDGTTGSLSKPKATIKTKLTKATLAKYLDNRAEVLRLRREADALEKINAPLLDQIKQFVVDSVGRKKTRVVRFAGYVLELVSKPGSVYWKAAFIDAAGKERAEQLAAEAPVRDVLDIRRA